MTATNAPPVEITVVSRDADLVERFLAAYSAIEQLLRAACRARPDIGLIVLANQFGREHKGWKDRDALRDIAELRNVIVHGRTEPYDYLSIPTAKTVERLEGIRDRLLHAPLAIPTFQRAVATAQSADRLSRVLDVIRQSDFSQMPVYEGRKFWALLTENGITRWLAHHTSTTCTAVDVDDVTVADVLAEQETRQNWAFVTRDARVDDVIDRFSGDPTLEAVLITANGRDTEALLGIATRWDVLTHVR